MRSVVEIGANVPAFLAKLWKLVNDSDTNHLISWSSGGKTFVLKNQAEFSRELLPLYYKHNNMASFIRQLNMYGFHKVTSVENNALRYEKDEIEFSHPCFMRGHAYLLEHIKRKIPNPKAIVASENGEKVLVKPEMMNKVLADVKQMKGKQETLDAKFSAMKQENEALWREVAILRQKHIKQQQIVNNLIQFLMSLVQPTRSGTSTANGVGVKRPYQLMINSQAHNSTDRGPAKNIKLDKDTTSLEEMMEDNLEDGPTIHELCQDDVLHSEASQDATTTIEYATIEVPPSLNNGQQNTIQIPIARYHVTMDDEEDLDPETEKALSNAVQGNSFLTPSAAVPSVSPVATSPPISPNGQTLLDPNILTSPSTSKSNRTRIRPESISTKTLTSPRSFNVINPSADLKLPAEIFASDDSVSDAGNLMTEESVDSFLQNPLPTKDKMLGGINIKLEKPESTKGSNKNKKKLNKDNITNLKLEDIKTELQDDLDWNNMSLATVNNNINKYHTVNRRDFISKNVEDLSSLFGTKEHKSNIDNHLDTMQTDLESLKELLRSDSYALDTNTLMGLFGADDPFYGLSFNAVDERTKTPNNAKKLKGEISHVSCEESRAQDQYEEDDAEETNQLISYTGNIPDFDDIDIDLEGANSLESPAPPASPAPQSTLNTPQATTLSSPAFNRNF